MEWVKVKFPDQRDVFVDSQLSGTTNEKFSVGEGSHIFDLGVPHDYEPTTVEKTVTGTTEQFPMGITFRRKVGT